MLPDGHALKELEDAILRHRDMVRPDPLDQSYWHGVGRGLTGALEHLEAFAAAHPGLNDFTEPCDNCGKPADSFDPAGEVIRRLELEDQSFNVAYPLCPDCAAKT